MARPERRPPQKRPQLAPARRNAGTIDRFYLSSHCVVGFDPTLLDCPEAAPSTYSGEASRAMWGRWPWLFLKSAQDRNVGRRLPWLTAHIATS